jgi:predicted RND superfamily exporter protein
VLVVIGGMGWWGEKFTVAHSTLPVILFASGSSYAVHVLGRFYADGGSATGDDAIVRAAETVQPPVAIAGLTTAAGFISFLVMDIRPMRAFGLECAAGVILCLIASLSLVPAVITLFPRRSWRPASTGRLGDGLAALGRLGLRRRWLLIGASVALGCATIGPMLRVSVRMEPSNFFRRGSEPWQAERFLDEQFGGSKFVEVEVAGDMTDPATLIELERLGEFARSLPSVTQVASVTSPLGLVNDAMGGGRRLPETRAQAVNLLFFLEGDAAFRSLLTVGRDRALVHVRVRGDAQDTVDAVQSYVDHAMKRTPGAPAAAEVAERLRWIATAAGTQITPEAARRAADSMSQPLAAGGAPEARVKVDRLLDGDGGFLSKVTDPAARARLEEAVARGDEAGARASLLTLAASPDDGERAWQALEGDLKTIAREAKVERALAALAIPRAGGGGPAWPPDLTDQARDALCGLAPAQPIGPAPRAITARLAGEPVLDRGFSRSVAHNQEKSLAVSLAVVIVLMFVLFRSPYLALVSVFPSALAMALVFGAMGLLHVRIDLSTSLVASIATGAGSDFAMHYLWYLKRATPDEVVRFVGPVMVVSSLLVAAGFAVLALGQSQPMRMFGSLAALAMAGAALLTFLLVPALLRRVDRPPAPGGGRLEGSA